MGLIDAYKAMKSIDEIVCSMSVCINTDYCHGMMAMKDAAMHAIEQQPTVDAVPVRHGHWEIVPNDENKDGYYKMRCSLCGETLWSIQSEELYCCKCGAKMDECADGERRTE